MHFSTRSAFAPASTPRHHTLKDFLRWKLMAKKAPWPKRIKDSLYVMPSPRIFNEKVHVVWIGHCTFLIQTAGLNILTDPVWSERVGPIGIGPKRVQAPGIRFEHLPKIDVVCISHNHYDHLDLRTVKRLYEVHNPIFITPLGNDRILKKVSSEIRVQTGQWGAKFEIAESVKCFIEPAIHWSARSLWDKNHTLWSAFVFKTPQRNIYFAGDTGYGNGQHFTEVLKKHGEFDLAFLPIGAFKPRWFMKRYHMDPFDAILAWEKLGCPHAIPMHYQTFPLANEGYHEPLTLLLSEQKRWGKNNRGFHSLSIGQGWDIK